MENKYLVALVVLVGLVVLFNQYQMSGLTKLSGVSNPASGISAVAAEDILPKGIPPVYGKELSVSFDDVSANNPAADVTIKKIGDLDNAINLQGADMQRYIKIASEISCEYCCGAKSIISPNGQAACGCAHSYAMRGLAKYLITKHSSEYTDDQILEELGKWKVLFFPGIHAQKAAVLKAKGIELNYINLASNKYRGIEKGAAPSGSNMVGGC